MLLRQIKLFMFSSVGDRIAAGTDKTWAWDAAANQATLTSAAHGLAAQGLTAGMLVHIGSKDADRNAVNAFQNVAANDMFGFARVVRVETDSIVFDKVAAALKFTDSTSPATAVDILFGESIRNRPVDHADYLEQSYQFEARFPRLAPNNTDPIFEYAIGNFCNTMTIAMPITAFSTVSYAFVGQDTETNVALADRKPGADTAINEIYEAPMSSSTDIARLENN